MCRAGISCTGATHFLGFNYSVPCLKGEVVYREMAFTETSCYLIIKKGNKCFHSAPGTWHSQERKLILLLCLSGTEFAEAEARRGSVEVIKLVLHSMCSPHSMAANETASPQPY